MINLNDSIWTKLSSANGYADKQLRLLIEEKSNFRENMELLADELNHQFCFYNATAYVLPYLAQLLPSLSVQDKLFLITQIGTAIAAEAMWPIQPDTEPELYQEFLEGLSGLRKQTKELLLNPCVTASLKKANPILEPKQEFVLSALSILGNRQHAYLIYEFFGSYDRGPANGICGCGWSEEEIYFEEGTECLEPVSIAPWDGKTLDNEAVWLNGYLTQINDEEIVPMLPFLYGTAICPQCGKREPYWTWYERFILKYHY